MGQSGDFASNAPPPTSGGGVPRWLIIVGVVIVLGCALIGVFACASPFILTLLGPSIGNSFATIVAGLGCQTENPELTADQCSEWAEGAATSNPDAMQACSTASSGSDNSTDSAALVYQCLLDEGVDPPEP